MLHLPQTPAVSFRQIRRALGATRDARQEQRFDLTRKSDKHRINNTHFRYCKVVAAGPLKHAAQVQRLQRVVLLPQVRSGPHAVRALEDLAGHAYVFGKLQLPFLVHDLDVVRLGILKDNVKNNRRMKRTRSVSEMPVMVKAAAYEKKVSPTMLLQVRI